MNFSEKLAKDSGNIVESGVNLFEKFISV